MSIVATLNVNMAIEVVLGTLYRNEFQEIDGLNQHPDGINFYGWLLKKKIIDQEEHNRIQEILKQEED